MINHKGLCVYDLRDELWGDLAAGVEYFWYKRFGKRRNNYKVFITSKGILQLLDGHLDYLDF